MSSLQKRGYKFVSDNEKSSEMYKKRREANKAAVDKFRNKEKETKDIKNKLLEERIQTLEQQIRQYDINRQIDINLMKTEFNRQMNELNDFWKHNFDQFASGMVYQQQQTNLQISQLVDTVNNLNCFIQNQSGGHMTNDAYCGGLCSQEDEVYIPPYDTDEFNMVKDDDFNLTNTINNFNDQNIPEYPFNDESCVPLNATFTTEGEVNFNDPVQSDLILPGQPPPQDMEELENVTDINELNYISEDNDISSFIL